MAVSSFEELMEHKGHHIEVVTYERDDGTVLNVAIECEDCCVVLLDFDAKGEG